MPWINVPQAPGAQRAARAKAHASQDHGWYQFRNAADAVEAELFLYDEVGGWFGATAEQFVDDLKGVTAPSLRVRVNSPGGSVFEGLAIANALRAHPANVTVQVDGLAASIASVIAMAADRVVMAPQSMLMIHEASGMCLGDSAEMAKMADVLDIISSNIADAYAAKAGSTPDDWRNAMKAETWYKAQDAVDAGLADELLPAKAAADEDTPEEMAARYDLAAYGYAGPPRPKPGPPPAKAQTEEAAPVALTITLGDAVGEQLLAALRASVKDGAVQDTASAVHHTATTDTAWDGPASVAAMPNDEATLRYCHAWYDPEADPDAKASYRFPHHKAKGAPANLAACRNGLARLEGSNIPDSDKAGVKRHLQAHLDDANKAEGQPDDTSPAEIQGENGPELVALSDPEPQPDDDGWDAIVAHLTTPAPNPWAQALSHLTQTPASSATDA